jgi:hypothetical protein
VPHLNHRRGDHRRRGRNNYDGRWICGGNIGNWHRTANRRLRSATSQALRELRARGFDLELAEEISWPLAREVDDLWNYD